jgi:hypothetical protein
MPSFFQFTQGTESHVRPNDSAPLLGRFRAVPPRPGAVARRRSQLGLLSNTVDNRGSVHILGYGAFDAHADGDTDDSDYEFEDDRTIWQRAWQRWVLDIWVNPRQSAVKRVVDKWWTRYAFLVLMPALLVCCAYMEELNLTNLVPGCCMVRYSISPIQNSERGL